MDRSLFRYIWTNSRREQIAHPGGRSVVHAVLLYSLDIPKYIVNDAIQGRAFQGGKSEAVLFAWTLKLPSFLGGSSWKISTDSHFERIPYLLALSRFLPAAACL